MTIYSHALPFSCAFTVAGMQHLLDGRGKRRTSRCSRLRMLFSHLFLKVAHAGHVCAHFLRFGTRVLHCKTGLRFTTLTSRTCPYLLHGSRGGCCARHLPSGLNSSIPATFTAPHLCPQLRLTIRSDAFGGSPAYATSRAPRGYPRAYQSGTFVGWFVADTAPRTINRAPTTALQFCRHLTLAFPTTFYGRCCYLPDAVTYHLCA